MIKENRGDTHKLEIYCEGSEVTNNLENISPLIRITM